MVSPSSVTSWCAGKGSPKDAGRIDSVSRVLDVRSRRGTLRAHGVLAAVGLIDGMGRADVQARKKKRGKKSWPPPVDMPDAGYMSSAHLLRMPCGERRVSNLPWISREPRRCLL